MLVPEIALTPMFARRLRTIFGSNVAILHSNLSQGERFDEWTRIRRGDARIAIGTRSAVFAPFENIGLVIVDEEHDSSYRQHESPFYNARDVAVMRAHFAGAVVVLGSATPAMESFYNAKTGKYYGFSHGWVPDPGDYRKSMWDQVGLPNGPTRPTTPVIVWLAQFERQFVLMPSHRATQAPPPRHCLGHFGKQTHLTTHQSPDRLLY